MRRGGCRKINKSVDIAGIKLLMPLEEVTGQMAGDGEYIYGMGGFGCGYDMVKKMRIGFIDSSLRGRVY